MIIAEHFDGQEERAVSVVFGFSFQIRIISAEFEREFQSPSALLHGCRCPLLQMRIQKLTWLHLQTLHNPEPTEKPRQPHRLLIESDTVLLKLIQKIPHAPVLLNEPLHIRSRNAIAIPKPPAPTQTLSSSTLRIRDNI